MSRKTKTLPVHKPSATYEVGYGKPPIHSRFRPGQSGNPLSVHYGGLTERWRDGDYLKLVGGETEPRHRLTLNPR